MVFRTTADKDVPRSSSPDEAVPSPGENVDREHQQWIEDGDRQSAEGLRMTAFVEIAVQREVPGPGGEIADGT